MKTLQYATVIITIIHSRQICTINHKIVGFQKWIQKLLQKRKITQSSHPVQYSIPVVHSTVCTYPYCHCDERSAEGPFRSFTAAKENWNIYSLEVLVKRQVNQITRHWNVTSAAMTELKWRYMCDCDMELKSAGQWHLIEFTQLRTSPTKPAIWYLIQLMMIYAHFMLPYLSQASQCFCPRALKD